MTFSTSNIFKLAEFTVDISRGEIRSGEVVHPIEPKVMSVLLLLVEEAGEVVAQEDIFDKVWPQSIYNPSSIQRCIAILRKAFNDDAKSQSIIVTHPKRGYSLNIKPESLTYRQKATDKNANVFAAFWWGPIALCILLAIYLGVNSYYKTATFNIVEMSPVTASELNDSLPLYSPNNQYIAFLRALGDDSNQGHIWLKKLGSDEEFQLSTRAESVLSLTWSPDSSAIIYAAREEQDIKINRVTLANGTSATTDLFVLKNVDSISSIHWHIENKLYFLAQYEQAKKLYSLDISTGQQKQLSIHTEDFKPYQIALSKNNEKLVILGFNKNFETVVNILSLLTEQNETIGQFDKNVYSVSWHPDGEKLLFSDGRQLFLMALNGQKSKIEFENYSYIQSPNFTPDGSAISLMLARSDSDVWLSSLKYPELNQKLINSNNIDWAASLSPDASKLVFISERKGYPQLYLYLMDSGKTQLLYENQSRHLYLAPPIWHPSKDIVASAISDKPIIFTLSNEKVEITAFNQAFGQPIQFYEQQNSLLLLDYGSANSRLVKFDLDTKAITPLTNLPRGWGHLLNDSTLIIVSPHYISMLNADNEIEKIQQFDDEIIQSVLNGEQLYLQINTVSEKSLWRFDLSSNALEKLGVLPKNTNTFWDLDIGKDMLLLETLTTEQDIVLLEGKH